MTASGALTLIGGITPADPSSRKRPAAQRRFHKAVLGDVIPDGDIAALLKAEEDHAAVSRSLRYFRISLPTAWLTIFLGLPRLRVGKLQRP